MIRHGRLSARGQSGATLIEVLVSVAVSSMGLLGLAGLLVVSAKVNHGAYLRSQSGFIAQSLIESIHINPIAAAQGNYDGVFSGDSALNLDCAHRGCSIGERATFDRAKFDHSLGTMLPNPKASLKCGEGKIESAIDARVYSGVCRLEVAWAERALTQTSDVTPQTLVWVFQP